MNFLHEKHAITKMNSDKRAEKRKCMQRAQHPAWTVNMYICAYGCQAIQITERKRRRCEKCVSKKWMPKSKWESCAHVSSVLYLGDCKRVRVLFSSSLSLSRALVEKMTHRYKTQLGKAMQSAYIARIYYIFSNGANIIASSAITHCCTTNSINYSLFLHFIFSSSYILALALSLPRNTCLCFRWWNSWNGSWLTCLQI